MVGDQLREKTGILEVVWRRFLVMARPWGSADKVNSHSYLYTNKKKSILSSFFSRQFSKLISIQKNLAALTCACSG